ncbi:hypothetical protein Pcinc_022685 [Petrolisthes cinctipes]|uniref:Uncharacterized protein n=1 Tax=Petrolisthes cinctipes TaxID=88211 RepID=A0AAE1FEK4_PETCI|nr:hypothetical protein Pcinc_022685 [Petrolisthes cinctipes]
MKPLSDTTDSKDERETTGSRESCSLQLIVRGDVTQLYNFSLWSQVSLRSASHLVDALILAATLVPDATPVSVTTPILTHTSVPSGHSATHV